MKDGLLNFYKDRAKKDTLEDIVASLIVDLEENKEYEDSFDELFDILPELHKVFESNITLDVGTNKFPLSKGEITKDGLLDVFNKKIKNKWVLAIDESQQEAESYIGNIFYRHSMAYGLKAAEINKNEKVLTVISSLRFEQDNEINQRKIDLLTYIQNILCAIYAASILIASKEELHAIYIDGPLIRTVGPFLNLIYSDAELTKLFNVDLQLAEKIEDEKTKENYSKDLDVGIYGKKFSVFDISQGKLFKSIVDSKEYSEIIDKIDKTEELRDLIGKTKLNSKKNILGIAVYFAMLKILIDLSRHYNFHVINCVKSADRTTEMLVNYYSLGVTEYCKNNPESILNTHFEKVTGVKPIENKHAIKVINYLERMNVTDSKITTFSLDYKDANAQFILPLEIRRHRGIEKNSKDIYDKYNAHDIRFGSANMGAQNTLLEDWLLEKLLPQSSYHFLMSYVRTSDIKPPLRIEFVYNKNEMIEEAIASTYLFSIPYQHYGIPIVLKYVDDLVRVPDNTFKTIARAIILDKSYSVLEGKKVSTKESLPIINDILGVFKRDFATRKGL